MNCPSYTLFLGDLSVYCTKDDLMHLFSPFGSIKDIRIMVDTKTGKNLSYGFVEYESIGSAIDAMRNLNGYVLSGRRLRIQWGTDKATKKPGKPKSKMFSPDLTSSVHVMFFSTMVNVMVSEESLRCLFSAYGFVTDVAIKKIIYNAARNSNEGYGFVHFTNINQGMDSAVDAVAALDNVTVGGVHYRVSMSKTLERKFNNYAVDGPYNCVPDQVPYYAGQGMYAPLSPRVGSLPPPAVPAAPYYATQPPAPYVPYYVSAPPTPGASMYPVATGYSREDEQQSQTYPRSAAPFESASHCAKGFVPMPIVVSALPFLSEKGLAISKELVAVVPALHSESDLKRQLEGVRDDCGAVKHSTIDVYRDVLEHAVCVDAADY